MIRKNNLPRIRVLRAGFNACAIVGATYQTELFNWGQLLKYTNIHPGAAANQFYV